VITALPEPFHKLWLSSTHTRHAVQLSSKKVFVTKLGTFSAGDNITDCKCIMKLLIPENSFFKKKSKAYSDGMV
jgi:hypothetical protein